MLLNERSFVVTKCASKDQTRPHLAAVNVEPDGTTVATDGHRMAIVTPPKYVNEEDFPGGNGTPGPTENLLLSVKAAGEIAADLKKKRAVPVEAARCAQYAGRENGTVSFRTNDLEIEKVFKVKAVDERFPPYQEVFPDIQAKDQDGRPEYVMVRLNAAYLKEAAQMAKDFGSDNIEVYISYADWQNSEGYQPAVLKTTHKDTGQELTIVVMPLRK